MWKTPTYVHLLYLLNFDKIRFKKTEDRYRIIPNIYNVNLEQDWNLKKNVIKIEMDLSTNRTRHVGELIAVHSYAHMCVV